MPSIRLGITRNGHWLAGLVSLLCLLVLAVAVPLPAEENPLDQLQNRSAETRWKSLRARLAERREERRERKKQDDSEKSVADKGKPELIGEPVGLPEYQSQLPLVTSPENSARGGLSDQWGVPTVPAPAEARMPSARDDAPPALVPVPHVPAPAPQFLPPQPAEQSAAVTRAIQAAEPLYQELFQLELTPSQTSVQSEEAALDVNWPLADPHPGLLDRSASPFDALPARQISEQRSVIPARPAPGLALPDLPLPRPADLRIAQQNNDIDTQFTQIERRMSRNELIFAADEYIKPIADITPFRDYEPNRLLRENDPYRNLCEHPLHVSQDNEQCPTVEDIPGDEGIYERDFAHLDFNWAASNIHYYPLYFQDVGLERYGHMHHPVVQPFVSIGKFSGQFLALPYSMTMNPPLMKTYPLGYLPPGDVGNPKLYYQIPFNAKAAMVTVGVYTGWFFLIP